MKVIEPWILGRAGGVGIIITDNIRDDSGWTPGHDGFRDAAIGDGMLPRRLVGSPDFCEPDDDGPVPNLCDSWFPAGVGYSLLRSGFNTGQIVVIYLPDSDGIITGLWSEDDDSLLYVGLDIANGDPHAVVEGLLQRLMDVQLVPGPGGIPPTRENNGLPRIWPDPVNQPNFFTSPIIVPFDADGDGNTRTLTRWNLPGRTYQSRFNDFDTSQETYSFGLYLCALQERLTLRTRDPLFGTVMLVPDAGAPTRLTAIVNLLPTPPPALLETWPPLPHQESVPNVFDLINARGADGLPNDDVEFFVRKVDSWTYYGSGYSGWEAFEVFRLRLAQASILTVSDSTSERSPDDGVRAVWKLPVPGLEVKKTVACAGTKLDGSGEESAATVGAREGMPAAAAPETNTELVSISRDPVRDADPAGPVGAATREVQVVSGSVVELFIDVENTGNVPLDVTLYDEMESVCGGTKFVYQAILAGANGLCNTVKAGDDIQYVAVNQPAGPGGIVILPGPNGRLDSNPAGDDVRFNPQLSVTVWRWQLGIFDGGNGIAETPKRVGSDDVQVIAVGASAPPFCEIVQPGQNEILDTITTSGDDVRRNNVLEVVPVTFANARCVLATDDFFGGPVGNRFLINAGATPPQPTRLGVLRGRRACNNEARGDVVRIQFRAIVLSGDTFCDNCIGTPLDVRNKIRAVGSPSASDPPFAPVVDDFDAIDTLWELGATPSPRDDNVVGVYVYCRGLSLEKTVALCTTCNPADPCGAFRDQIVVPRGPFTELCIRYQYTVTNTGELDEEVRLTDEFLCDDVASIPGASVLADCGVCPGSSPFVVPSGQTATRYCTVRFANEAALTAFLAKDDVPPGVPRTCGTLALPGQTNPRCYTNCARVTGQVSSYPGEPEKPFCPLAFTLRGFDTAQVCGCCATIDVTKDAACLTDGTPGEYGDPPPEDFVPGSRARFRVTIRNTSAEGTPVSKLRITDTLAGTPAACVTLLPGTAVFRRGAQVCPTPAGFNIVGTPFEWDLATCGGDLPHGQSVEFTFDVQIADDATENCDPVNTVRVEAQPNCGPGLPPFWCGEDTDTANVNVRRVGLTCTKQWRAEWDSNVDCQPGPGLKPGPTVNEYTNDLDLRDVVFPVRLHLRVTATNTGEVPLNVTPADTILCSDCVRNTPGVTIESSEICSIPPNPPNEPVVKTVAPGGTQTWTVVLRVESAEAMRTLAQTCDLAIDNRPGYFKNRVTVTGTPVNVCPGNAVTGSPCEAQIQVPEACTLTIDKKVGCVPAGGGNPTQWLSTVEALPGARLRYRIQITNTGTHTKIPRICVTDTLCAGTPPGCICRDWFQPATVRADINGTDVTNCVRPTFRVDGVEACFTFGPCRPAAPWVGPGEVLSIYFDIIVPPDYSVGAGPNCAAGPNPECRNTASVRGFTEACPPANATACTAGPVQAEFNVKVPALECQKTVCLDANNDGTCDDASSTSLNVNCERPFPLSVIFEWRVRNTGETGLTQLRICDPELLADVCAANAELAGLGLAPIQLLNCALCDGPCCPPVGNDGCAPLADLPLCNNQSSVVSCRLYFPTREAWLALEKRDGSVDHQYRNSSTASAKPITTGLCPPSPVPDYTSAPCEATVRIAPPCNIAVDKQVRCTTACGGTGQGSFGDGPRDVVAGSGFEFTFTVRNLDTAPYAEQICELEITDTLTGPTNWNPATWIPCEYWPSNCESGPPIEIAQCFKADGTPYRVILPQPMQSGRCLRVKPNVFKPCIPDNPVGNQVTNTVVVRGAPPVWVQSGGTWALQSTAGAEPFCCSATDTVTLNIRRPAVACVKEWCAQWDSNANGVIDAGDATIPCTNSLDLCPAVFPVRLSLRVTAQNTGNVGLLVTPNDAGAINCMESRGATVGSCELRPPVAKPVPAGGSATWTCEITVPDAQVMRDIAEFCDPLIDTRPRVFLNRATVTGVPTGVCPGNSVTSAPCEAEIRAPEPCNLTIDKRVKCVPEGDALYRYAAEALPGGRVKYRVQICNLPGACQPRVPQIELRDVFCNAGAVDAATVRAEVNGVDVTACLPAPLNFSGGPNYITFGPCLPGRPWLEPGECLTLTFEATAPAGNPPVNCVSDPTPECRNRARAVGYTEARTPPPAGLPRCNANPVTGAFVCVTPQQDPANWQYWVCADVNVRVPRVACTKLVTADVDGVAGYEIAPAQQIDFDINSATFPIRVRFIIRARNTGELPLGPVVIDDDGLIPAALAAGVAPADIICSAGGPPWNFAELTNCGDSSAEVGCEITFRTEQIFRAFLARDGEQEPECFTNVARVVGTPIPGALCGTAGEVSSQCTAAVCITGRPCCPPVVKAVAEIWNQNEVRMSGTERCVCAWDQALLSRWTLESGLPNHFLRQFLHTDRGRARIDGLRSVNVCGEQSQARPLLGVAMKYLRFGSDVTQAGVPLTATGEERGLILIPGAGPPRGSSADDILTQLERLRLHDPGVPDEMPAGQNLETTVASSRRADTTEKGSFLAFVKVEIKWDSSGRLIQDTFIQLTNDGSSDVFVKIFQVNDNHRDCPAIDNTLVLTRDEPAYWAASTGGPKGVSPFTLLDPQGDPDTDPYNPGGRVLRGYVIAYAVNSVDEPIRWNHLTGAATVVNYARRSAWEYNPWSFRAWSAEEGQVLAGNPGQLEFDGVEYDWAPARLLLEFFAPGAVLRSSHGKTVIVDDTELTLWAMFRDLTQY